MSRAVAIRIHARPLHETCVMLTIEGGKNTSSSYTRTPGMAAFPGSLKMNYSESQCPLHDHAVNKPNDKTRTISFYINPQYSRRPVTYTALPKQDLTIAMMGTNDTYLRNERKIKSSSTFPKRTNTRNSKSHRENLTF